MRAWMRPFCHSPLAALLFGLACVGPASAQPADSGAFAFAALSGVMRAPGDETGALRLLDAIGLDRTVAFTVYDGNFKGANEACIDQLYDRRETVLNASSNALVVVPGQFDWASCGKSGDGSYDPVERLDFLRQELMSDSNSLGQVPLTLTRESEVPRFRPFRENARWVQGDTVFISLNAPSPNNRYLTAGGRNGEFDDRALANDFWIEHAAEYAKRRNARAVVIFMEADPQFQRDRRHDRFGWLTFDRPRERDGFRELRHSLVKAAATFRGPLLLIHASDTPLPAGFVIDRPLHDEKGAPVENLTRLEIGPRAPLTQWVRVGVHPEHEPIFRVSLVDVPKRLPKPAVPPIAPSETPQVPDMPQISSPPSLPGPPDSSASIPAATPYPAPANVPPLLPETPGQAAPASQPLMQNAH